MLECHVCNDDPCSCIATFLEGPLKENNNLIIESSLKIDTGLEAERLSLDFSEIEIYFKYEAKNTKFLDLNFDAVFTEPVLNKLKGELEDYLINYVKELQQGVRK